MNPDDMDPQSMDLLPHYLAPPTFADFWTEVEDSLEMITEDEHWAALEKIMNKAAEIEREAAEETLLLDVDRADQRAVPEHLSPNALDRPVGNEPQIMQFLDLEEQLDAKRAQTDEVWEEYDELIEMRDEVKREAKQYVEESRRAAATQGMEIIDRANTEARKIRYEAVKELFDVMVAVAGQGMPAVSSQQEFHRRPAGASRNSAITQALDRLDMAVQARDDTAVASILDQLPSKAGSDGLWLLTQLAAALRTTAPPVRSHDKGSEREQVLSTGYERVMHDLAILGGSPSPGVALYSLFESETHNDLDGEFEELLLSKGNPFFLACDSGRAATLQGQDRLRATPSGAIKVADSSDTAGPVRAYALTLTSDIAMATCTVDSVLYATVQQQVVSGSSRLVALIPDTGRTDGFTILLWRSHQESVTSDALHPAGSTAVSDGVLPSLTASLRPSVVRPDEELVSKHQGPRMVSRPGERRGRNERTAQCEGSQPGAANMGRKLRRLGNAWIPVGGLVAMSITHGFSVIAGVMAILLLAVAVTVDLVYWREVPIVRRPTSMERSPTMDVIKL